jgi:hypothetical protein
MKIIHKKPVRTLSIFSTLLFLILATGCAMQNSSAPVAYNNEITISNNLIALTVAPEVGRIVAFGKVDGPNLLWRNSATAVEQSKADKKWINYGGDKVWPSQINLWRRFHGDKIPDPYIDGTRWKVLHKSPLKIVMQSPLSKDLNLKITRTIELAGNKPAVKITNLMERMGYSPFPVYIWTVTQVKQPLYCQLDVAAERPFKDQLYWTIHQPPIEVIKHNSAKTLQFGMLPENFLKVCSFGRWCAAIYVDCVFKQSTSYDPKGCYPDRASVEVFWTSLNTAKPMDPNAQPEALSQDYVELETLSPQLHLKPGQKIESVVTWELLDRKL